MDIGLLVGTPFAGTPHLGDLIWASNTGLESNFVFSTTAPASLDQVTQTYDAISHTLKSVIDEQIAKKVTSEFFVSGSGLFGHTRKIDAGEIDITFSADAKSLTGTVVFIGDGYVEPGTFAWYATFSGSSTTPPLASVPNDFNKDGKSDILWQNTSGATTIWQMNGGNATPGPVYNVDPSWKAIGTGDFNADNKSDILWQNTNGAMTIWEMNGGNATPGPVYNVDPSWKAIGTGDFNGDSKSDILWQNTNGAITTWEMNGSIATPGPVYNVDPSWHAIGTGDFNGDSKSDILWQNTSGATTIWQMDGTIATPGPVYAVDPSWHAIGTGDFNGDSKSDILWQNTNGATTIWLMNGGIATPGPVYNVDPSWHPVAG
jgi:hypothetical protein